MKRFGKCSKTAEKDAVLLVDVNLIAKPSGNAGFDDLGERGAGKIRMTGRRESLESIRREGFPEGHPARMQRVSGVPETQGDRLRRWTPAGCQCLFALSLHPTSWKADIHFRRNAHPGMHPLRALGHPDRLKAHPGSDSREVSFLNNRTRQVFEDYLLKKAAILKTGFGLG
ncbi:MAG: hypothetical protein LBQ12_04905 [Deltaproteobacteria bacterium]|nr:hypothetical protein [Deltaproteobacteria bacterium]